MWNKRWVLTPCVCGGMLKLHNLPNVQCNMKPQLCRMTYICKGNMNTEMCIYIFYRRYSHIATFYFSPGKVLHIMLKCILRRLQKQGLPAVQTSPQIENIWHKIENPEAHILCQTGVGHLFPRTPAKLKNKKKGGWCTAVKITDVLLPYK